MSGVFSMKPNTRNVRDLDFEIKVGFKKKNVAFEHFPKNKYPQVDFNGELGSVSESNTYRMR